VLYLELLPCLSWKNGGERRTGCGIAGVLTRGVYHKRISRKDAKEAKQQVGSKPKSARMNPNFTLYKAKEDYCLEIFE